MANILPPYIADLVLGFSRRSTEQLESLVALRPSHQAYLPLQNALNSVNSLSGSSAQPKQYLIRLGP
jgi:hypothetical protein